MKIKSLHQLLFSQESKSLIGNRWINFWLYTLVFLISFFALGFSTKSLESIRKSMSNPFTNFVNLDVTISNYEKLNNIIHHFDNAESREMYSIDTSMVYSTARFKVLNSKNKSFYKKIRTVEHNDPILKTIIDSEEKLNDDFCSIIVTRDLLETLGFGFDQERMAFVLDDDKVIWVRIKQMVETLPDKADILMDEEFYFMLTSPDKSGLLKTKKSNEFTFSSFENLDSDLIKDRFKGYDLYSIKSDSIRLNKVQQVYYYTLFYEDNITEEQDAAMKKIQQLHFPDAVDNQAMFTCVRPRDFKKTNARNLVFYMKDLDNVGLLNRELKTSFGEVLNLTLIKSKENFSKISRLSIISNLLFIIISILSLSLFSYYIITNHLSQKREVLGFLKANGVSNALLSNIYIKVFFYIILISLMAAFILLFLINALLLLFGGIQFIKLISWYSIALIASTFIFNYLILKLSLKNIINSTPGNLIYNR